MTGLDKLSLTPGGLKGYVLAQSCMQAQKRLVRTLIIHTSVTEYEVFQRYRREKDMLKQTCNLAILSTPQPTYEYTSKGQKPY